MTRSRRSWTSVFEIAAHSRRTGSDRGGDRLGVRLEENPGDRAGDPAGEHISEPATPLPSSPSALCLRLEEHWHGGLSTAGRERSKPATAEEILAFEQRNGVNLPADLREYFERLNGLNMDGGYFRFWPLSRLIPLQSSSSVLIETSRYFLFADYMVGTWYYAIYLGDDPFLQHRVILHDFPSRPLISSGFSQFIELYLADSPLLYGNQ
jgi:SMI1 / KNR4 family (SUKH-1)